MKINNAFRNSVIPGFYPDPSICRVNDDYYLVNSSFEYFPGLPVFHSTDLVNWEQIGYVLDSKEQLNLDNVPCSNGLFAPTIRYYNGKFYVICTLVGGRGKEGNFVVISNDPKEGWSEPYRIKNAPGIDPSLFFDEDGRVWYTGNRVQEEGESYPGHREIWLQEFDLDKIELKGKKYSIWGGIGEKVFHVEAPHLYKIDGMYYLLTAEGGTEHNHSVVISRSENILGPYKSNPNNPIVTHRDLGDNYPIACTGHADLVKAKDGKWWMVLLATRPYGGYYYNLGRETFLAPIIWDEGYPKVSNKNKRVKSEYFKSDLEEKPDRSEVFKDDFKSDNLNLCWNFLRTPDNFWNLKEKPNGLRLYLKPDKLSEYANPVFIGRRQRHIYFEVKTKFQFIPQSENECAGIVLLQNNNFHFRFIITKRQSDIVVHLLKRDKGDETILNKIGILGKSFCLKIKAKGQDYSFFIKDNFGNWQLIQENVDGRILSPTVAGSFTGTFIGMYASSNGKKSDNYIDFDWFEYKGIET